ncbi:MAG TPA: galactokinase [Acidobacteria bacterium]|nr:galactokinase [Acidobacteriota bacterium]HAK55998.1 galactokinase [Acidobacteriota bacterium]
MVTSVSEPLASRVDDARRRLAERAGLTPSEVSVVISPYRVCPIGAHSDHQGGPVLAMAVSAYTLVAFAPARSSDVTLTSDNFSGEVSFDLARPVVDALPSWGAYPAGAARAIGERHPLARGIVGHVHGSLPGGGLSSSASVTLAYLMAFAAANGTTLDPTALVDLALRAERDFVGVKVGILDPAAIVGARRDHLLAIETRERRWRSLAVGQDAPEYRILVAFSGITRNLSGTDFNRRIDECFDAARGLAARAGRDDVAGLHDLTDEVFEAHGAGLSGPQQRRARHFFGERSRVRRGATAWQASDLATFGQLMRESCTSSIDNWEAGSPELIAIQQVLTETGGVFGSRFSGAGWGGCCVALIEAERASEIVRQIEAAIRSRLPELTAARVLLVESEDGLRMA